MKRIVMLVFLSTMILSGIPFKLNAQEMSNQDYLKKSRNQKTTAWILLGGGVVVGAVGIFKSAETFGYDLTNSYLNSLGQPSIEEDSSNGTVFLVIGALSAVGSIPLFISASNNAGKAARLSLKNQPVYIPIPMYQVPKSFPAITVNFLFNKAEK